MEHKQIENVTKCAIKARLKKLIAELTGLKKLIAWQVDSCTMWLIGSRLQACLRFDEACSQHYSSVIT